MKKQKFVCALFAFFMLLSCSDEDASVVGSINSIDSGENESSLTEQEAKVLYRMREADNRVSMDEVTKLANEAISILAGETGETLLKSGSARRISSISALVSDNSPALKSSESDFGDIAIPDTLAYILNFNDSLGFAIVSADTRIDNPLLAFTDNSSLIDSTDNPGIAIFLERLEDYMLNSIVEAEEQKDSLLAGIMEKIGVEAETKATLALTTNVPDSKLMKISQVTPLVPVEWGQREPFNNYVGGRCVDDRGVVDEYPAGCVATALAQIMAYWKYPSKVNNYPFDWTELRKYTAPNRLNAYPGAGSKSVSSAPVNVTAQFSNLFQQIGKSISMKYSCEGSGASTSSSVNFLSKLGFKTGGIKDYDLSTVMSSLNAGRPLMATGCKEKTVTKEKFLGITYNTKTSYDKCHQWVIDGYLKQKTDHFIVTINLYTDGTTEEIARYFHITIYNDYLHNNWGWYGSDNGYFVSGIFNYKAGRLASNTKSYDPYNYQYRIEIVPNIYR